MHDPVSGAIPLVPMGAIPAIAPAEPSAPSSPRSAALPGSLLRLAGHPARGNVIEPNRARGARRFLRSDRTLGQTQDTTPLWLWSWAAPVA